MNHVTIEQSDDVNVLASKLLNIETLPPSIRESIKSYKALHWIKHVWYEKESSQLQPYAEHVIVLMIDDKDEVIHQEYNDIGRCVHNELIKPLLSRNPTNIVLLYKYSFSAKLQLFNITFDERCCVP